MATILELILKYPRLVIALFAALLGGLMSASACIIIHGAPFPAIYISSAMLSSAIWAAIIGKRVLNLNQSCSYFRAAMLGAGSTLLAILSVAIFINIELRLQNMINGLATVPQTISYLFIDDRDTILGGGVFVLIFLGWYLVPIGAVGGLILRWLRTLYEKDESNTLYEGDDRASLHIGTE